MKANERQVGSDHYRTKSIQPWDAMDSWMSREQYIGFLRGNAIKYLSRAGNKGPAKTDYEKAHHYLEKLLELFEENHDEH